MTVPATADLELARTAIVPFLEVCVSDEKTGHPVRLAAHHRMLLDVLDLAMEGGTYLFCCAPVRFGKTSVGEGVIAFLLGRDPTLRAKIVCANENRATERASKIKRQIERNGRLRALFPDLRVAGRGRAGRIFVRGHDEQRDPALEAVSVTSGVEGSAVDLLWLDDADDKRVQVSAARREEVRGAVVDTYLNRLEPGAAVFGIATRWHAEDLFGHFADDEEARAAWMHLEMRIPDDLHGLDALVLGDGPHVVLPLGWRTAVSVPESAPPTEATSEDGVEDAAADEDDDDDA